MIRINVNGKSLELDVPPDTPLLWALRDSAGLTGSKYGCGLGLCGACSVLLNGTSIRSCSTPISAVGNGKITTIEGLDDKVDKALQAAWQKLDVAQCGYCQSGQLISASALLRKQKNPTDVDIDAALAGNLCRCATYVRIRAAVKDAAKSLAQVSK
jgi:isoquinoline 1-oxidoreductase alpha subunit